ncbi:hypothetical protein ACFQL8_06810 [Streptomyces goshikiensis]|uniref:hypothetical protein n=1 Tax=Streptomyces goshikiensis TaxID=1942 RepID=UPI0016757525|nr:hypothetical protein [Streptomyces goshikiensis]GHD83558.1 hypothetical protein GCM10010336_75780 [Streptomyces goshikiensis]
MRMTVDFVIRYSSTGEPRAAFSPLLASPGSSAGQEPAVHNPPPAASRPLLSGLVLEAEP